MKAALVVAVLSILVVGAAIVWTSLTPVPAQAQGSCFSDCTGDCCNSDLRFCDVGNCASVACVDGGSGLCCNGSHGCIC